MRERKRNLYDDPAELSTPHFETVMFVCVCLSNAALILCRYNVGFRVLQPWIFRLHVVGLLLVGWWMVNDGADAGSLMHLDGFCLWTLAMGLAMNFWRLRGKAEKMAHHPTHPLHTRSRGNSYMTKSLRGVGVSEKTVQRWLEPINLLAFGACLINLHVAITGWYLALVGTALGVVEAHVLKEEAMTVLDMQDAMAESRAYQQTVPTLQPKNSNAEPPNSPNTPRPVASISPELERLRHRKGK